MREGKGRGCEVAESSLDELVGQVAGERSECYGWDGYGGPG